MTEQELKDKAAELFPLPDKKYYVEAGESFSFDTAIVLGQRELFVQGGMYVIENTNSKNK